MISWRLDIVVVEEWYHEQPTGVSLVPHHSLTLMLIYMKTLVSCWFRLHINVLTWSHFPFKFALNFTYAPFSNTNLTGPSNIGWESVSNLCTGKVFKRIWRENVTRFWIYFKTCHTTFFSHNLFLTQIEYEIIILKLYDIMTTRYSGGGRMISWATHRRFTCSTSLTHPYVNIYFHRQQLNVDHACSYIICLVNSLEKLCTHE
jgi:hypothetical protein